ncbi:MAG: acyl-CoA thioesterase [Gammaproteobacteria bacterium]|nr:acyl-CoA thioesterase [Gammaproteobacteria bacterium]
MMDRGDFRSCYAMDVRWGDVDMLGHVNNVQFLRYAETARAVYFRQHLGLTMGVGREGFILAEISCQFLQQLLFPGTVEVLTRVSRLGRSSLDVVSGIFRADEEKPVAISPCRLVWFDFEAQKSAPVPQRIRDAVIAYEVLTPEGV